jgi:hypothetical protein
MTSPYSCDSFLKRSVHLPLEGSVKSAIRREVFCSIRVRTPFLHHMTWCQLEL